MNVAALVQEIKKKHSYLCVGLDTDVHKLPPHLKGRKNAVAEFNKAIIDATKEYCVSYKMNTAFYESMGIQGWQAMEETLHHIPHTHFSIADAKRGDIGNTSAHYAKTFFETLPFDAVTVNPYMGEDSVRPFLDYQNKVTILLGLTSNKGAADFELQRIAVTQKQKEMTAESSQNHFALYEKENEENIYENPTPYLYEMVLEKAALWGTPDNIMFVAGATQTEQLASVRRLVPHHFLLVPGVGAQGGSLAEVSRSALNSTCGLLVNASRAVIYAGSGEDFANKAGDAANAYQSEMSLFIQNL